MVLDQLIQLLHKITLIFELDGFELDHPLDLRMNFEIFEFV